MKIIVKFCCILSLVTIISCSKNEDLQIIEPVVKQEEIEQPEIDKDREIPKIKLITDLNYLEDKKIPVINEKDYPSTFVKIEYHPFGFYIPEGVMRELNFEDGSRIGLNDAEYISLFQVDRLSNPNNIHESLGGGGDKLFIDGDLSKYEEYVGSAIDIYGVRNDGFLVKHKLVPDTLL